jgi:hypothetical protein
MGLKKAQKNLAEFLKMTLESEWLTGPMTVNILPHSQAGDRAMPCKREVRYSSIIPFYFFILLPSLINKTSK